MPEVRKINYFEIFVTNDLESRTCIDASMNKIQEFNRERARERQRFASSGGIIHVVDVINDRHFYNCRSKLIRDEFPEITDKQEDTVEAIAAETDENKGIHDETHFVISTHPQYPRPIIAVESCMKGPKHGDIRRYLENMLIHSGTHAEFNFEPVFGLDLSSFNAILTDVAEIRMIFHRDDILRYNDFDPTTGALLRAAMNYGDSEYITLEFNVNFQRRRNRYPTGGLINRVRHFVNILTANPEAKGLFQKLDVKAEVIDSGNKLKLFDLIESKIAREIRAERRRPRSQYYNSASIYAAIRSQIENDFGR